MVFVPQWLVHRRPAYKRTQFDLQSMNNQTHSKNNQLFKVLREENAALKARMRALEQALEQVFFLFLRRA